MSEKEIVNSRDSEIIAILHQFIGKVIPLKTELSSNNFGIVIKNGKISALSLYGLGLDNLPEEIFDLVSIKVLNLSNNNLKTISDEIGKLGSLETLNLYGNNLMSIPENIKTLKNLRELKLFGNNLLSLPEFIGSLKSLDKLIAGKNKLTRLPESLKNLSSLTSLIINYNDFHSFPKPILNLKNLKELILGNNHITTLPESLLELSKLEYFDIRNNPLDQKSDRILKTLKESGIHVKGLLQDKIPKYKRSEWYLRRIRERALLEKNLIKQEVDIILDLSQHSTYPLKLVSDFDDDEVRHQDWKEYNYFSIYNRRISELEIELNENFPSLPKSVKSLTELKTLYLYIFDTGEEVLNFQINLQNLGALKLHLFGKVIIPHHFNSFPDLGILEIINNNRPSKRNNVILEEPEKIWELEDLVLLYVLDVKLTDIPESIKNFKSLWRLKLWNNGITHIPENLFELEKLKFIDLRGNSLDSESINILMELKKKGLHVNY